MSGARGPAGGVVEQRPERERPTVTTRGRGARAVRLAAAVASALVHLVAYCASALVWGASPSRALAFLRHWSVRAWRWLDLEVRAEGIPSPGPCVYVANHRSYLDVPLLAGVLGASFMSRADVAGWWIVGAAAKLVGSVFVERDDPRGRVRAARGLARRLASASVIVFPEGKTGARRLPGPFHPGLFRRLDRLGDMDLKTRVERAAAVFVPGIRRERDRRDLPASLRAARSDLAHQRVAVLVRHADVAEDDVGRVAVEYLERRRRRADGRHACAAQLEAHGHRFAHVGLVFDEEHVEAVERQGARAGASREPAEPRGVARLDILRRHREPHREGGALALARTRGRHRAAVPLDQVAHDRQPEPQPPVRARARAVGLPEALEDVRQEVGRNPDARVTHADHGVMRVAREPDGDAPAARRELDGVGDEVPDDLLQPVAIAAHGTDAVVELALEGDLLRVGRRTDRVDGALDGRRQVDGRQLETQLAGDDARDLEEVLDEASLELRVALDHLERAGPGFRLEPAGAQEARPDEDGAERRPQLVRERGEELVLRAVRELRLGTRRLLAGEQLCPLPHHPPPLPDVARDALHAHRLAVAQHEPRAHLERHAVAVPGDDIQLVDRRAAGHDLAAHHLAGELQVLGRDDLGKVHAGRLGRRVAGDPLGRPVDRREVARQVVRVDQVVGVLEEPAIALLALAQRPVGARALGDVPEDALHDGPSAELRDRGADLDRHELPVRAAEMQVAVGRMAGADLLREEAPVRVLLALRVELRLARAEDAAHRDAEQLLGLAVRVEDDAGLEAGHDDGVVGRVEEVAVARLPGANLPQHHPGEQHAAAQQERGDQPRDLEQQA